MTQPYATWGHDKEDADTASGYNLDDESDWAMDPDIVTGNETAVKNALKAIPTMSVVMNWNDLFGGTPQPGTFAGSGTVAPAPQGIYIMGRSDEREHVARVFQPDRRRPTSSRSTRRSKSKAIPARRAGIPTSCRSR